jgi:hypothetical protein
MISFGFLCFYFCLFIILLHNKSRKLNEDIQNSFLVHQIQEHVLKFLFLISNIF